MKIGIIGPNNLFNGNLKERKEILKYLIGKGNLNINKFAEIDFMNLNIEWRHFGGLGNAE